MICRIRARLKKKAQPPLDLQQTEWGFAVDKIRSVGPFHLCPLNRLLTVDSLYYCTSNTKRHIVRVLESEVFFFSVDVILRQVGGWALWAGLFLSCQSSTGWYNTGTWYVETHSDHVDGEPRLSFITPHVLQRYISRAWA